MHLAEHSIAEAAPASYARTLLHLRWVSQNTALLGSHALQAHEAAELTLHSMKSTMLANAAQIMMAKEHRMQQGHHRDSALLYSRNDTFSSLHVQRSVAEAVAKGFRPERSMARGAQAPLPEPPFSVSDTVPARQIPHSDSDQGHGSFLLAGTKPCTANHAQKTPRMTHLSPMHSQLSQTQNKMEAQTAKQMPSCAGHSITSRPTATRQNQA